jgi:hypothetical protein
MSRATRLLLSVFTALAFLTLLFLVVQISQAADVTHRSAIYAPNEPGSEFGAWPLAACLPTATVTSTADNGPGTLRQALADVCSEGTVDFASALANRTITLTSDQLRVTKTVTITNPYATNLKINGNGVHRVFLIQAGAAVTIDHLSIISGTVTGWECSDGCGGGILVSRGAALTVTNSAFIGNLSGGPVLSGKGGGGIYSAGRLIIDNCSLSDNQATGTGGGIYSGYDGILEVNNCTFSDNLARNGGAIFAFGGTINKSTFLHNSSDNCGVISCYGGGIFNAGESTLTVADSSLLNNSAVYQGGGVYNSGTLRLTNTTLDGNSARSLGGGIMSNGVLTVTRSIVRFNSASSGGGLYLNSGNNILTDNTFSGNSAGFGAGVANYAATTITNTIFTDNRATTRGGAIGSYGPLAVNNSTFVANSAISYVGGGIDNGGVLTVTNSTFSGNSAATYGGGIRNYYSRLTIDNSTFSGNVAGISGGGIYLGDYSTLHLRNSTLANSSIGGDCFTTTTGKISTNLNNLIEDGSCGAALAGDPLLGPLQDNGGPTPTHALLPGSPAIDAGDSATCLAEDQRGVARPQLDGCDIGAFESRGFTLGVAGGNNQVTLVNTAFAEPLAVTLTSNAGGEPVDGGLVTFSAPTSGPSVTFAPAVSVPVESGLAALSVTANSMPGDAYSVTVGARGGNAVGFTLRNTLPVTLSVARTGSGGGTVSSQPGGIACGTDCWEGYPYGSVVTLTATPDSGSAFAGWSGACNGSGTCSLTMTAPKHITAAFVIGYDIYLPLVRRDGDRQ